MDDISHKIRISYTLNKQLDKYNITRQLYGKTLYDIDGELKIFINDIIFFDENGILLLEFGITLRKWLNDIGCNIKQDYLYRSIDDDGDAILEFRLLEDDIWEVLSDWSNTDRTHRITTSTLIKGCELFVLSLEKELLEYYGLKINTSIF